MKGQKELLVPWKIPTVEAVYVDTAYVSKMKH